MDEDLEAMSREQLMAEVRNLRRGIRTHHVQASEALRSTQPYDR